MAYGGVNVPGPSGRDFTTVGEKTADALVAGRLLTFREIRDAENRSVDAENAQKILHFNNQQILNHMSALDEHDALLDSEVLGEVHEITFTNTQAYPFNSSVDSPVSVALTRIRKNLFYTVETEIKEHNGLVGDIVVSGKALNGFKISVSGSYKTVTLIVRIKGGMT